MNPAQFAAWQAHMGVAKGQEWEPLAGVPDLPALMDFLARVPFFAKGRRRYHDAKLVFPQTGFDNLREISIQAAFGKILDDLSKGDTALAAHIVTTSPDVTGSTNLGP